MRLFFDIEFRQTLVQAYQSFFLCTFLSMHAVSESMLGRFPFSSNPVSVTLIIFYPPIFLTISVVFSSVQLIGLVRCGHKVLLMFICLPKGQLLQLPEYLMQVCLKFLKLLIAPTNSITPFSFV